MKKVGKIILTVLSILSFLCIAFVCAVYYVGGLSHLYYSQAVVNTVYIFCAVAILVLAVLILMIVTMFRSQTILRHICTVLLIAFIPLALFGSQLGIAISMIIGPNGCSYTEDIANYGKYDYEYHPTYFPDAITADMTVVKYAYFYKYLDTDQIDIYLEVKFRDQETMDKYLAEAKDAFSEDGVITYQNPYDPNYTDIIRKDRLLSSIYFSRDNDYKYVNMRQYSITYSYEELTIIYNYTSIGSDIEVGNDPDRGEYYPKYLERFGVEWDWANNFRYEYTKE